MPYSPWLDAGESFQWAGAGFSPLGMARLRELQDYRTARLQQIAQAQADREAAQQQAVQLQQARMALLQAQTEVQQGRSGQQKTIAELAQDIDNLNQARDLANQGEAAGIPKPAGFDQRLDNTIKSHYQRIAAMSPASAATMLSPHNISQNQIAIDKVGNNMVGRGPTVLSSGQMYQLPGSQPIVNTTPPKQNPMNLGSALDVMLRNPPEAPSAPAPIRFGPRKGQMSQGVPLSLEYQLYTNLLHRASMESMRQPLQGTSPQPLSLSQGTVQQPPPLNSGEVPTLPSASAKTTPLPVTFRDATGKRWQYIGSAQDPMSDRNTNNWQEVQ